MHSSAYRAFQIAVFTFCSLYAVYADIESGDTITKENAAQAEAFLEPVAEAAPDAYSPNFLVQSGG